MNQQQTPPSHVALCFVGPISYPATKALRSACCHAINQGSKQVTLLISSWGGATFEGFALYHFLRSLPIELITHNIGSIQSIANVVFMAGHKRLSCVNARFMFHDLTWIYGQQETLDRDQMKERVESLEADVQHFHEILKSNTLLTVEQLTSMHLLEKPIIISPDRAMEIGLIHEISDATLGLGIPVFNVEF